MASDCDIETETEIESSRFERTVDDDHKGRMLLRMRASNCATACVVCVSSSKGCLLVGWELGELGLLGTTIGNV